jgi:hypothetical protein
LERLGDDPQIIRRYANHCSRNNVLPPPDSPKGHPFQFNLRKKI